MELTPYSLADNTLEVHLRGLDEPIFLSVSESTARQVTGALLFPENENDDGEPHWLKFEFQDRSTALISTSHLILLRHLFDFGAPVGPPPTGHSGDPVTEAFMDAHEWTPPLVAFGIEGLGRIDLYDQGRDTVDTLADTVPDGFVFSPFFGFSGDDGEWTVVATERLAFVTLHAEVLAR